MKKAQFYAGASAFALLVTPGAAMAQAAPAPQAVTNPQDAAVPQAASNPPVTDPQEVQNPDSPDVLVTARKRTERLQDVPSVVTAVTGQLADDLGGLKNTRDLAFLVPGVTMIESAQGATAEPNIRGAGQARLPNSDAAIGLYRDGAYIVGGNLGGRTFQRFDLFDADRIEVLKGPQGALYGRNAVGGAINIITRHPTFDNFEGLVAINGGSQTTYGGQLIANIPVSDVFAVRVGADATRQRDGFYYDTVTNTYLDNSEYTAGRLSLRYKPSSALDIVFTGDYAVSVGDIGENAPRPDPDGNPFLVQYNTSQRTGAHQYNLGLSITWNLPFAQLVSTSNFRKRNSFAFIDNDGGATAAEVNAFIDKATTIFQEVRLQGSEGRLNWLVGADLFHLRDIYDQTQSGRALIVTPAMGMTPASTLNPNLFENTDYGQTGYSGFASLEFKATNRLTLEGEGRYSIDEKDEIIDQRRFDGTPRYAAYPPGSPQSNPSATYRNFSGGATASYRASSDILGFAKVATAYRSGGFNAELGTPCTAGLVAGTSCNVIDVPSTYGEEHSINYEVGLKTSWFERRLLLNANVYRTNYRDILVNLNNGVMAAVDPLDTAMFLTNGGNARLFGFEIEMAAKPQLPRRLGKIEISGGISHQNGELTSVNPGLTTLATGNRLGRIRPFSITGNVDWRLPLGHGYELLTAFSYIHEGGGLLNAENTFTLDDTDRGTLRVAVSKRQWELSLQIQNVFNSLYYVNQSGTATNGLGTSYRVNDPRSFLASLKYTWGTRSLRSRTGLRGRLE